VRDTASGAVLPMRTDTTRRKRYRPTNRDRNRGSPVLTRMFAPGTRLRPALILALCSVAASSRVIAAQSTPAADSTRIAAIPTAQAAKVAAATVAPARAKSRDRMPIVFYGTLGTAAVTAALLHVDPDSGGYHDGWNTATDFPDKAVHALAAWAITNVGVDLGAKPRYAALAVCAAGTAFEFAQGYVSVYDIAADCAGAAGAAAWQSWRARRKARPEKRPPAPTVSASR